MCGDGTNDLLALKEADLSLGIRECDASYASSFTISSLLDVDEVIRESKSHVSNIIEFFLYMISGFIFSKIATVILISNRSDLSSPSVFYYNFTSNLLYPFVITWTKPSQKTTKYVPVPNFMKLHSHLVIWGNAIIGILPLIISFVLFENSDYF